jgi:hypothetical protein
VPSDGSRTAVDLEPEARWVLACCSRSLGLVDERSSADGVEPADGGLDWSRVLLLGAYTRTAPLIGSRVDAGLIEPPEWVSEMLRASWYFSADRNSALREEAGRVGVAFVRSGISAAFRKGVHLCSLYPAPGVRPFSDIDILIRPEDTSATVRIMEELGYVQGRVSRDRKTITAFDRPSRAFYEIGTNAIPTFVRLNPGRPACRELRVDVARRSLPPRFGPGVPVAELLDGSRSLPGLALPVPSPLHQLLDLCCNLFVTSTTLWYVWRRKYRRLTPFLDLRLVIDSPGLRWAEVVEITSRLDLMLPVGYALGNLERVLPGSVPETVAWALRIEDLPLDAVGHHELDTPYVWPTAVPQRLFGQEFPADLPRPRVLL